MKEEADVKAVSAEASYAAARATVSGDRLQLCSSLLCECLIRFLHNYAVLLKFGVWPVQEFLIEALAARAFQLTHTNNRDIISYGDVGRSQYAHL